MHASGFRGEIHAGKTGMKPCYHSEIFGGHALKKSPGFAHRKNPIKQEVNTLCSKKSFETAS